MIEAAAQLFTARPDVEAVSVDEVAALAGVSKATLYRYFPSKVALIQAAAERAGVDAGAWEVPDRRTQIIEAAVRLIPQRGLRAMTMEQIAESAGISPATIYWHFKSKDDLILAVADYCSPLEVFRRNLARGADGDPQDDLRRLMREMLAHASGRFEVVMTCMAESWASPRVAAHFMRTVAAPAWATIGGYFEAQVKAGRLRPAPFIPRLLSLAGPVWAYLIARRALGGVAAEAASELRLLPTAMAARPSLLGGAPNPLGLLLALASGGHGMGEGTDAAELTPEQLVDTHVATFLAGNATPEYLEELRRRGGAESTQKEETDAGGV